jgi:hypothetical protein
VRSARCEERVIGISTTAYEIRIDLQRVGRVTWLKSADTWRMSSGVPLPSARLLLDDGSGLDFTKLAKTKRITVTLLSGVPARTRADGTGQCSTLPHGGSEGDVEQHTLPPASGRLRGRNKAVNSPPRLASAVVTDPRPRTLLRRALPR